MIYTVTFNASLDYIVSVEHFEKGRVNRTKEEYILPGGKGINVSMVLKNLGVESYLLGFTAGFTGYEIKRLIKDSGCSEKFIDVNNGISRINVKLRSDEESEINGLGPNISKDLLNELIGQIDELKSGDILVLAGSIPTSIPNTIYYDIMKRLTDKNIKVVVDATNDLLLNVLTLHPFLIKPNNHELSEMLDMPVNNKEEVIEGARRLQDLGAKNVLVSMAKDGAVLLTEDGDIYESEAHLGKVKNSVGAGDSMVAGFIYGYLQNNDYKEAFEFGLCSGSASAFSEELAKKNEVEKLMLIQKKMTKKI